jgi:hypothetical protein
LNVDEIPPQPAVAFLPSRRRAVGWWRRHHPACAGDSAIVVGSPRAGAEAHAPRLARRPPTRGGDRWGSIAVELEPERGVGVSSRDRRLGHRLELPTKRRLS